MYQTETAKSILLEDGTTRKPVASLLLKGSTRAHIAIEEECYVLFIENPAGRAARSQWLPLEAYSVLCNLPPPNLKSNIKESQLTIASRALKNTEAASEEEYDCVVAVTSLLSKGAKEELKNIVENGPVWDGDLIGKNSRDVLFECNLARSAVSKGSEGYQTATRLGFLVYKQMNSEVDA